MQTYKIIIENTAQVSILVLSREFVLICVRLSYHVDGVMSSSKLKRLVASFIKLIKVDYVETAT